MNGEEQELNGRDIIIYTRSILPSLSNKEKLVAEFIINNYVELSKMTINDVSDKLNVSEATIVKLSKKLQCNGYLSLRKTLSDYALNNHDVPYQEEYNINDSSEDIFMKVFRNSIVALQDTMAGFDKSDFKRAVNALKNAKKVLVLGLGGSGSIADDIAHKFLKVGIEAQSYRDTHMQLMASSLLKEGDIAIGISHSGTTASVNYALQTAKKTGAITICITNHVKSPITENADIQLVHTLTILR
ncbi:sialic acid utilization regulator [Gracilibacillus boraciitolerans JCM 21714]|uniref:Sialic acid utilization regulator n=1 Tax=Gracilibacillus boraciitolerans JCM 21714 TaxID=1298598 RepID=W4VQB3_9BACI|nr:SIS domain-containing protein [Gracilibacillus boraciitolerans]GAE95048.1 sialic acid utilization regulator [Gracilibacillus boraciitolerans JCM 21714]